MPGSHTLGVETWKDFKVNELFEVKYGINMELNTCIEAEDGDPDAINFVARTESNNGVSARVRSVYKELHADHETGAADNK